MPSSDRDELNELVIDFERPAPAPPPPTPPTNPPSPPLELTLDCIDGEIMRCDAWVTGSQGSTTFTWAPPIHATILDIVTNGNNSHANGTCVTGKVYRAEVTATDGKRTVTAKDSAKCAVHDL